VYIHRHADASHHLPGWLSRITPSFVVRHAPSFVVNHARLLLVLLAYGVCVAIMGFVSPQQPIWMRAAGDGQFNPDSESAPKQARMSVKDAFSSFGETVQHAGSSSTRPALILVTAAGGGIRAAYWTAAVLGALEDRWKAFAQHVFAISAVSGGALGASTFKALTLYGSPSCDGAQGHRACAARFLAGDFIGPNVIAAASGEVMEFVSRGLVKFRARDEALEEAWATRWIDVMGKKGPSFAGAFDDLFVQQPTPALLLNGDLHGERRARSHLKSRLVFVHQDCE
jgi:hypothetical protein